MLGCSRRSSSFSWFRTREKASFELAERFRKAEDPDDAARLGDELGKMVFGR
jgi:hypothetical protein